MRPPSSVGFIIQRLMLVEYQHIIVIMSLASFFCSVFDDLHGRARGLRYLRLNQTDERLMWVL